MSEIISLKILSLLKQNNMTQKRLSELTNITESAISHYIKGDRVPRGVVLIKMAQALGVSAEELLDDSISSINKNNDFNVVKTLIARNAQNLTMKEKMEIINLLTQNEEQ